MVKVEISIFDLSFSKESLILKINIKINHIRKKEKNFFLMKTTIKL
jgi:hypothetical protein